MSENLCCPECDHSMDSEKWEDLENEGVIVCPGCGEELGFDDLLSDE